MSFTDDLESKIQATYLEILKRKSPTGINGKTLNCDSFRKIVEEIKSEIMDGQNRGLTVLEMTNNIILKILKLNFFVYNNHEMAAIIGYIYLKRQGVVINNFSKGSINNGSTLDEIKNLTASW